MVDVSGQTVVAILTRAPSAGGKTRLFAALERDPDPTLLAALLLDTLDRVRDSSLVSAICFTPASAEREMRAMVPSDVLLLSQRSGDLGARMRAAFDDLFARGAAAVLLIGSDIPSVESVHLAAAGAVLADRPDAVILGPATDGGYYLIGATRTPNALLDGIEWGTTHVLERTVERARAAGLPVELLPPTSDIDSLDDLRRCVSEATHAPRTRQWWHAHEP